MHAHVKTAYFQFMEIVVIDGGTLNPGDLSWDSLKKLGKLTIYNDTPKNLVIERCQNADAIITNKVVFDKATINQLPRLRYIGVSATGINNIDLAYAKTKNIRVENVAAYSTASVAQHVFALLLNITNQVAYYNGVSKSGFWSHSGSWAYWEDAPIELAGKTMGIIGFGNIGQKVAQIALALDMKVIVSNRSPIQGQANIQQLRLNELIPQADVISLHCALGDNNFKMVNADFLNQMKKEAILINTARGGLINEFDLASALKNETIKAAALDVLQQEPPHHNHPLLQVHNCYISPHLAWASKAARQRLLNGVCEKLKKFKKSLP